MVITSGMLIGGGIGALVGSLIQTTDKGKQMDKEMRDALKLWNEEVKDCIPWDKTEIVKKLVEK